MKKHIYTINIKILTWFMLIMAVSSVMSFSISNYVSSQKIFNEIKESQIHFSNIVLELSQNNNLSTDLIISTVSSKIYPIEKITDISNYSLTDDELGELTGKGYLYKNYGYFNAVTLVKIRNDFAVVSINPHANIFFNTLIRTGLSLIFSVILGLVIAIISSQKALKPIRSLIKATQEVARGNFSVRLENKSNDEVGKLTENFNIMTSELSKIEMLRMDFIGNVSHEFKTPIASIQGFASLLQHSELTGEQREYTDIIVSESSRLSNLISNILKLSKLENQDIVIDKKTYYIDEHIRRCLLLLDRKMQEKNINLEVYLDKIKYYGNEELIDQVFMNLIDNAVKYSKDQGEISICCIEREKCIIVSIKDNGIGMNKETQERIYEKFFQGDKAHNSEGNGLGLALVKRIIDIVGGAIEVDSKLGVGSVFTVTFPKV